MKTRILFLFLQRRGGKIIGPSIKHDMLDDIVPPCQDLSYINYKHTKIDKILR